MLLLYTVTWIDTRTPRSTATICDIPTDTASTSLSGIDVSIPLHHCELEGQRLMY